MKNKIICHYPYISKPKRKPRDKRTLCGEEIRTDEWINGSRTYHMFTIFPEELKCKECRKLAKNQGLIRYENLSGGVE